MYNAGMVKPGSTIQVPFNTFDSNDPSASVAIAAFVVGDIEIYKDGGVTQRASDSGVTLLDTDGIDFDGHVGIGGFSIDLSDNDTAGFYEAGSRYFVVVGPTTVDAAVVNFVAATFEIGYEAAILNTTMATRASATSFTLEDGSTDDDAYNNCPVIIHNLASAFDMVTGYISDYTGGTKTVTLVADPGVITSAAGDHLSILPPINVAAWNGVILATTNPLPNAAPDAAAGLPVSDGGGLDLDAILVDTADMQPLIEKMAYVGSHGLGVWIDDGAANTNTVLGTDGTPDNPISTIAAATTVATALGSQRFYLVNDTEITLAQTYEGYEFIGVGVMNKVTLGSQDVDNSLFRNVILTGTQGGTQFMRAIDCQLEAILSAEILADDCWLTGDITLRAATNHSFGGCKSGMPGNATPDLTFPGSGTTSVNFRHYSGGLTVKSATTNDTMSYESDGQFIIDATCTSLTVSVRGNCSITDNGTTTSLTQDAAVSRAAIADEVWDEILTGATHNVQNSSGRKLRQLRDFGQYELGAVWVDTVDGAAGTVDFENATVNNPSDSIADARVVADSVGLKRMKFVGGSTGTLGTNFDNFDIFGENYTLVLGTQSVDHTVIDGGHVSGVFLGTAHFDHCEITNITGTAGFIGESALEGTITQNGSGDWFIHDSYSAIAGLTTPVFDFGVAVGTSNVSFRSYSGGIELLNMGGSALDNVSIEGDGQVIININCIGGTAAIRGHFVLTDNSTAGVTIAQNARFTKSSVVSEMATGTIGTALFVATGTITAITNTVTANVTQLKGTNIAGTQGTGLVNLVANQSGVTIGTVSTALGTVNADMKLINGTVAAATALGALMAPVIVGTAITGTLTTTAFTVSTLSGTDTEFYKNRPLYFISGALSGQLVEVTDSTAGTLLTISQATTAMASGDQWVMM